MVVVKLKERIEDYKRSSDYKLLGRIPMIIVLNGRSFSKLTQLIDKPHCSKFSECMLSTMLRLCSEIEGVVFSYQHSDQILLVCRNDQKEETSTWFDGKIQKIASAAASIASVHFNECASTIKLNLTADPIFTAQVFNVPDLTEVINTIIFQQQQNFYSSIQFACLYELLKKYNKNEIKEMLSGLTVDEKKYLLLQECGIDFNDYPVIFRKGSACYKVIKEDKLKWFINTEIPIFTKDHGFLSEILKNK